MKKPTLYNKITLVINKLVYGTPKLCAKHSIESRARTSLLDSFNCEKCSTQEKEISKMEQEWFNLLSLDQMNKAQSNYDELILDLDSSKDSSPLMAKYLAYKKAINQSK
jgi:hypothetical protein